MKKLITAAVASAFAFLAIGAGNYQPGGTSFESSPSGEKTVEALTAHEDDGVGTGDERYWIYGGGDTTAVVGVVTNGAPVVPSDVPSRPDQFAGIANNQYLNLEGDATNVLYRAVKSVAGKTVETLDGESIGDGLYLDTLVKFTSPTDSTNDFVLASGDKLAITYIEETEDDDGDGVLLSNIVVRAGYVENGKATEKNYTMILPSDLQSTFVATNWHRLTVRAITVGYGDAPVGFVIYLDGCKNPLTYATDVAAGDTTYTDALAANPTVNAYLYNSTTHALLPSAVSSGTAKSTLAAVGFKGTGCVDDISFVSGTPGFVDEGKGVTIGWDSGVATVTVKNGDEYLIGTAEAGEDVTALGYTSSNLLVAVSTESLTVTAKYKTGDGYEADTWDAGTGSYNPATDTFTLAVEGDTTLTIKSMLPKFEVNNVKYGSFQDALDNAAGTSGSPATIKMLASWTGDIAFDGQTENFIILDLAGQTLTGDSDAAIHTGIANIIITNSTVEIGHVVAPDFDNDKSGTAVICDGAATLTVTAGIFDGAIVPDAQGVVIVVTGGKFYDNEYAEDPTGEFYLAGSVDTTTYTISDPDENFYFTVSENSPTPTPTVVQIPTAALNLVYTGNQQTGVDAGEGYTLSGTYAATDAGNYIATATLDQDCVWSDETTAPKEINWSIAADTSATVDVVLTDYEEEYTAQLAFPTASATIGGDAVVGTAVWSPDTITEPAAGATNTYTATFTVMSGNYAGSSGTATFKVYKQAASGWDPKPEDIDPATTAADKYPDLVGTALATANAKKLTEWAEANSVDYAAVTSSADTYVDAFLLNCDPTDVEDAKADFKATITVNADGTVTVTAPGDYNVTPTIQGKQTLSNSEAWHTKTDGDKFFRAVLSL